MIQCVRFLLLCATGFDRAGFGVGKLRGNVGIQILFWRLVCVSRHVAGSGLHVQGESLKAAGPPRYPGFSLPATHPCALSL